MPDKKFVVDLVEDEFIQSIFLVTAKEHRTTRNGDPYVSLSLADRSGSIDGRIWDDVETMTARFDTEDFVAVRAQVSTYNDKRQLNIDDIKSVDESELELRNYLPHSRWDGDEMFDQLAELVDTHVESELVRRVIDEVFADETITANFKRAPAAKSNHHDFFGGLLEHCLSMSRLAVSLTHHYAHYYPGFLNQDLVIAGCILHDIGKLDELSYDRAVEYTTEGKLVGHITGGVELVNAVAERMDPTPPDDLLQQLKHLVLSHHGKREYGSPVEPRTPEAMLLHQIDMVDSRMNLYFSHLEEHRNGAAADAPWTSYHRALESDVYAGPEEPPPWAEPLTPDSDALEGPGLTPGNEPEADAAADDEEPTDSEDSQTMDLFGQ
jgi:3'-5' exoribonuclease